MKVESINDEESASLIKNFNNNTEKEKFLFFFTPDKVDFEFLCGCSLHTGAKVISILFIINSLFGIFFSGFNKSVLLILSGLAFSIGYLVSGIFLYKSTITFEYSDAYFGYAVYAGIWIVELILTLSKLILIFFRIYNPFDEKTNFFIQFITYLASEFFSKIIALYFVWIVFCYSVNIKLNRKKLILLSY